jgi:hypothetical protein
MRYFYLILLIWVSADLLHLIFPEYYFLTLIFFSIFLVSKIIFTLRSILFFFLFIFLSTLIIISTFNFDLVIFLKYSLIIFIIFFKFKKVNILVLKQINISLYYFLVIMCLLGIVQFYLVIYHGATIYEGHLRPIGLSVEPTWFSQQLAVVFIFLSGKKFSMNFFTKFAFLLNIFLTITRTSILVLFYFLNINLYKKLLFLVSLAFLIYLLSFFNEFSFLLAKVNAISSLTEEPRYIATSYMLKAIFNNPFGHGFISLPHYESGLIIGSSFGNIFLGIIYTFGFLALPIIFSLIFVLFYDNRLFSTRIILISLFLSFFMPYLFSFFSLFLIYLAKISDT